MTTLAAESSFSDPADDSAEDVEVLLAVFLPDSGRIFKRV